MRHTKEQFVERWLEKIAGMALRGLVLDWRRRLDRRLLDLEERIAFHLRLDELAELEVGVLQEANGLLQLGGHDQLLALSQLQFGRDRHRLLLPQVRDVRCDR